MDHRMSSPPWRERAVDAVRTPLGAYHDAGLATWSARIVADRPAAPVAPLPWAVPLCCLLAMIFLTALVTGRQGAVAAVPDLAGLYSAVGLAVHVTGLAVQDVDAERRVDGTGATIKVRGRVVNHGTGDLAVPPLILEFQDTTGAILHGSIAAAPVARLSAGGTATFVVEVERVPSEAGQVVVRLQDAP